MMTRGGRTVAQHESERGVSEKIVQKKTRKLPQIDLLQKNKNKQHQFRQEKDQKEMKKEDVD